MSNDNKHLVIDYFFGLCDSDSQEQAAKYIEEDINCSRLYQGLKSTVGSLESISAEKCPESLVESMYERVRSQSSSQKKLEGLLRDEINFKQRQVRAIIATVSKIAATILIVIGLGATYMPATRHMRQVSLRNLCSKNLANIGISIAQYAADNAGMLPSVGNPTNSPWWQVGSQQQEHHSNTRNLWILVRTGYADINDFTCQARPELADSRLKTINACDFKKDFPSKDFVHYSFRIVGDGPVRITNLQNRAIAADSNPLFEEMAMDKYTFFKRIVLNDGLRTNNSINHEGAGQNILLIDNSVEFNRNRQFNGDDIYTIRGIEVYEGYEMPTADDVFLAP